PCLPPPQLASNSTDVLDSPPVSGTLTPVTAGRPVPGARSASQLSRAGPREPRLRSLTVILTFSPGTRSSAGVATAASRATELEHVLVAANEPGRSGQRSGAARQAERPPGFRRPLSSREGRLSRAAQAQRQPLAHLHLLGMIGPRSCA